MFKVFKKIFFFLLDATMFVVGVAAVYLIYRMIVLNGGVDGYVVYGFVIIVVHFITFVIGEKSKERTPSKPIKIRR